MELELATVSILSFRTWLPLIFYKNLEFCQFADFCTSPYNDGKGQVTTTKKNNVSRPRPLQFFGPPLFVYYLLLVTFVRTKTNRRYFYLSSPQLSTKKTLNI